MLSIPQEHVGSLAEQEGAAKVKIGLEDAGSGTKNNKQKRRRKAIKRREKGMEW